MRCLLYSGSQSSDWMSLDITESTPTLSAARRDHLNERPEHADEKADVTVIAATRSTFVPG